MKSNGNPLYRILNKGVRKAQLAAKWSRWQLQPCPCTQRETRLVAGAQRSGTNLVMDILEQSSTADVYHEHDPRAFDNYIMRPWPVIHTLRRQSKAPLFVIKALCESQHLPALLNEFAPAKAVWVIRHYHDVVNSMEISFPNTNLMIREIGIDRTAGGWRTEGMSDATYAIIQNLVAANPEMTTASASALQWYFRNILLFEKNLHLNPDVQLLRYESLVTHPETVVKNLFHFFGLPYRPAVHYMISPTSVRKRAAPQLLPEIEQLCEALWDRFARIDEHRFA
jgi:hypothetical protein